MAGGGRSPSPRPPEEISAVQFCAGCAAETWDIYGAIADAAISMSFSALRFGTAAKRLDLEERAFLHAADAAAPRIEVSANCYLFLFRRSSHRADG